MSVHLDKTTLRNGEISGFGELVTKLVNSFTGYTVAYVGVQNGNRKVYFPGPVTPAEVEAVARYVEAREPAYA